MIALAWEFSCVSRNESKSGFWLDTAMSAIRGCGFALGTAYSFGAARWSNTNPPRAIE